MKFNSLQTKWAIAPTCLATLSTVGLFLFTACQPPSPNANEDEFTVGMILVGPHNDAGWNQSNYEGMQTVAEKIPQVKLQYVDRVNPGDRPNVQASQVADDLIDSGAKMIIFNSDDFKDDALATAKKYPDVTVIHTSGDSAWKEGKNYQEIPNLGNIMGRMEYGKMMAGCAAALGTETGKIGYLGPLTNDETRRYVSSAYLGAKYCWQTYRQKPAEELTFKVTWIGFWFNIPGKTLDPTKVADDFYNSGFDVVMSGIDTPEAAVQGKKAAEAGKNVKYVHYDYTKGCEIAPDICLGIPYYNWAVPYQDAVEKAIGGTYTSEFVLASPDWSDINNPETSAIGFIPGQALGDRASFLNQFIQGLGNGSIQLFKGRLNFQDGTVFLKENEMATDEEIWYLPKLLEGMEGSSS